MPLNARLEVKIAEKAMKKRACRATGEENIWRKGVHTLTSEHCWTNKQ